jgi:hypothetical protein
VSCWLRPQTTGPLRPPWVSPARAAAARATGRDALKVLAPRAPPQPRCARPPFSYNEGLEELSHHALSPMQRPAPSRPCRPHCQPARTLVEDRLPTWLGGRVRYPMPHGSAANTQATAGGLWPEVLASPSVNSRRPRPGRACALWRNLGRWRCYLPRPANEFHESPALDDGWTSTAVDEERGARGAHQRDLAGASPAIPEAGSARLGPPAACGWGWSRT